MILRTGIIAVLFTLFLSGCSTTKPLVWKAQDVSFSNFKAFEIQLVFNATDKPVDKDALSFLTAHLKEQFAVQNLQLNDVPKTKNGILIVQTDMLVYETSKLIAQGGSVGYGGRPTIYHCKLGTRLVDKLTTHVVATIFTVKEVAAQTTPHSPDEWVLKESAAAVAKEVAKMMRPMESEPSSSAWQQL